MTDDEKTSDRERNSQARVVAISLRDHYLALVGEGFTPDEAMKLVQQMIASSTSAPPSRRP